MYYVCKLILNESDPNSNLNELLGLDEDFFKSRTTVKKSLGKYEVEIRFDKEDFFFLKLSANKPENIQIYDESRRKTNIYLQNCKNLNWRPWLRGHTNNTEYITKIYSFDRVLEEHEK